MTKVTFKKHPAMTGLAGIGYSHQNVDMKIKKKKFGEIVAPTWQTEDNRWYISIKVVKKQIDEDGNPNCKWKWVHFKQRFVKEEHAREWIQEYIDELMKKYILQFEED